MAYRIKSTLSLGVSFPLGEEKYLTLPAGPHEQTVDALPANVLAAMQSGFSGTIVVETLKVGAPKAAEPKVAEPAPAPHAPAQDVLSVRPPLKK
jgi:hypothetical protein